MTLPEMIETIEKTSTSKDLQEMVIAWVREAHQEGFREGMIAATKTQSAILGLMSEPAGVKIAIEPVGFKRKVMD